MEMPDEEKAFQDAQRWSLIERLSDPVDAWQVFQVMKKYFWFDINIENCEAYLKSQLPIKEYFREY